MKIGLQNQARMLAHELDYFQTRRSVVNQIKNNKDDESAIERTVTLLYELSKSKSKRSAKREA